MTYSLSIPPTVKADAADALAAAGENWPLARTTAEVAAHLEAAIRAVREMAGAVGLEDGHLSVSIAGHANPDHAPAGGWADEFLSITVQVARDVPSPS